VEQNSPPPSDPSARRFVRETATHAAAFAGVLLASFVIKRLVDRIFGGTSA
jgi:hypothetical protein